MLMQVSHIVLLCPLGKFLKYNDHLKLHTRLAPFLNVLSVEYNLKTQLLTSAIGFFAAEISISQNLSRQMPG